MDGLTGDEPFYLDMGFDDCQTEPMTLVRLCTAGARVVPLLEDAYRAPAPGQRRLLLARLLAWYGSPAGLELLAETIERGLAAGALPVRESKIRHAGLPPDQGAMPDLCYLLFTLGMVRAPEGSPERRRILRVLARVTDCVHPRADDFRDRAKGVFHYVEAVCHVSERLGDPEAVPLLLALHGRDGLHHLQARAAEADFFLERMAYLEVTIGRALARCGAPEGVALLASYLDDARAILAEHAHDELVAVTGQDLGKDARAWGAWLRSDAARLQPAAVDAAHRLTGAGRRHVGIDGELRPGVPSSGSARRPTRPRLTLPGPSAGRTSTPATVAGAAEAGRRARWRAAPAGEYAGAPQPEGLRGAGSRGGDDSGSNTGGDRGRRDGWAGPAGAESTEVVVGRHVQAFLANDVDAIMADYAEDALLCAPEGAFRGHAELRAFFERVLPAFPAGATTLDIKQQIVDGELFYVVWSVLVAGGRRPDGLRRLPRARRQARLPVLRRGGDRQAGVGRAPAPRTRPGSPGAGRSAAARDDQARLALHAAVALPRSAACGGGCARRRAPRCPGFLRPASPA